ncbi:hypothetical protein [Okeania sp. KiyG1]|nr:hypothetical protein [Okeania sp. KiyG1]
MLAFSFLLFNYHNTNSLFLKFEVRRKKEEGRRKILLCLSFKHLLGVSN